MQERNLCLKDLSEGEYFSPLHLDYTDQLYSVVQFCDDGIHAIVAYYPGTHDGLAGEALRLVDIRTEVCLA